MSLKIFVERENYVRKLFKIKPLDLSTHDGRQEVADLIDTALSPENLTCDGELSEYAVRAKYRALVQAAAELTALDPSALTFYSI
jgi:hypothetical protein